MNSNEKEFFCALSKVVYLARRQQKLSQRDLAEKAGVDRSYISDIERGKRNPSLGVLLQLAESLSLPLSVLILRAEYILEEKELL